MTPSRSHKPRNPAGRLRTEHKNRAFGAPRRGDDGPVSWDLDEHEARELVQEYLAALAPPEDDVWVITNVVEHSWGWAVSWVNKRWAEGSTAKSDMYGGGGPYLVDRKTGRVAMCAGAAPPSHYIDLWRAGEWPDIPRP